MSCLQREIDDTDFATYTPAYDYETEIETPKWLYKKFETERRSGTLKKRDKIRLKFCDTHIFSETTHHPSGDNEQSFDWLDLAYVLLQQELATIKFEL